MLRDPVPDAVLKPATAKPSPMLAAGILTLTVRGLILLSRLALTVVIARTLPAAELGTYGIIAATVATSVYFLGWEFHLYSSRELVSTSDLATRGRMLRDQLVLYGLTYILFVPVLVLWSASGFIPLRYIAIVVLLVIAEHLTTEAARAAVVLGRPVAASLALFVESGAWALILVGVYVGFGVTGDLGWVVRVWAGASVASVTVGLLVLKSLVSWERSPSPMDWQWIKSGLRVAVPFWVAALLTMLTTHGGRFFLHIWGGDSLVGVYTFYTSFANVLPVAVESGLSVIIFPRLLSYFENGDLNAYRAHYRTFVLRAAVLATAVGLAVTLGLVSLVRITGRAIYQEHFDVWWVLVVATWAAALAVPPYYRLYVCRRDRAIVVCVLLSFVSWLIATLLLVPRYGLLGAAVASAIGAGVLAISRQALADRLCPAFESSRATTGGPGVPTI